MADNDTTQNESEQELVGLLAEFETPEDLVSAAEQVREAGYTRTDAYSPFPVHGLDEAMGIRPTLLPWLVLAAGLGGGAAAIAGQWWTNTVDYPFLISGKPLFSLPANIPVAYEVIILLSAFAAFFGMLALNGLPRLANPLFRVPRFVRATTDRFFLSINAKAPKFVAEETRALLSSAGAVNVEGCSETSEGKRLPRFLFVGLLMAGAVSLIPPLWIAKARLTKSDQPRWHTFIDMDYQPKYKPQHSTTLFERVPVAGTVARGELQEDDRLYRGLERPLTEAEEAANDDEKPWVTTIPLPVTDELMLRGRQRYNIYCSTCHGRAGEGDGLVSKRAMELQQGTWIPPVSLQSEPVRKQPAGQLFNTITHGVRKMPSYASQIAVEDRWAIVLYLRALQRTQNATPDDVPADVLKTMRDLK